MSRPPRNGWSKDKKYFNGKPVAYWEAQAKKNVVDHLVRGSIQYADQNCLPRELTSKQLMSMALTIDRFAVAECLQERENFQLGMAAYLASALLPDKKTLKKILEERRKKRK